jgi:hypothetical protein
VSDPTSAKPKHGWGFPSASKKAHYFHGGRSLCGKWGFFGTVEPQTTPVPAERGPDDCAECHRKLKRDEALFVKAVQATES